MALILVALAWLAAIATVAIWAMPPWFAGVAIATFVPPLWFARGRGDALVLVAMASLAVVGAYRFHGWQHRDPPSIGQYLEQSVVLDGTITSEPDPGLTNQSYLFAVDRLANVTGAHEANGTVRVSLGQDTRYLPGTRLRLTGRLADPPVFAGFDYRHYLYQHGIAGLMQSPGVEVLGQPPEWSWDRQVAALRLRLDSALQRTLPEPEASLAGGVAFGRDGNLPDGLAGDFRDTGLAHIVAVSGSNVSLVAALVFGLLTWLVGRKKAFWAVVPGVLAYVVVAGLSASVIRAGVMAIVLVLGSYLGKPRSSLAALAAAAILMTLVQPSAAQDIGFQLSLSATAGIIVFSPWIQRGIERGGIRIGWRLPGGVAMAIAVTLSATAATMPITLVNFQRLSLAGPLANVLIEPLFVVAFWLSVAVATVGAVWQPGGWFIGLFAYYPLSFITWFAAAAASLPFAAVDTPAVGGGTALISFAVLCIPGWFAYRYFPPPLTVPPPSKSARRAQRRLLITGAGAAALVMAFPVSLLAMRGPGAVEFSLLNVGSGDAVLITTPHGRYVLVDGGESGIQLADELGAVLPHWKHGLDALFTLQPADEQTAAIPELLRRYEVRDRLGVGGVALVRGDRYVIDGVTFEALWPATGTGSPTADSYMILRVTYGAVSFVIPANASTPDQAALVAAGPVAANVLVLPHHGANKTDLPFIEAVNPAVGLVPVGSGRYAPSPGPAIIDWFGGRLLLRTDVHGRITIRTDGQSLRYSTRR